MTFKDSVCNIVGKGENAGNQHFLLSPQIFQPPSKPNIINLANFILSSANALNLDQFRYLLFGKELIQYN